MIINSMPAAAGNYEEFKCHINDTANPHSITADQAGAIPAAQKGAVGGVAELGQDGKVPLNQLPVLDSEFILHQENAGKVEIESIKSYRDMLDKVYGILPGEMYFKQADTLDNLPTSFVRACTFSPDGELLIVSMVYSPFIAIYKRDGATFTRLNSPDILPPGAVYDSTFSLDGRYLALGCTTAPYIAIYKREGDTFLKIDNPTTTPPFNVYGIDFSPDGQYLACAHSSYPYITIYKNNEDHFIKLPNPSYLPDTGEACAFSHDGRYLAFLCLNGSRLVIYKRKRDTFVKMDNPDVLPPWFGKGCMFSPDDSLLVMTCESSPYLIMYKKDGDRFTRLPDLETAPPNPCYHCTFDRTGNYLAATMETAPFLILYKRTGDTFIKLPDPEIGPTGAAMGCAFDLEDHLAIGHRNAPFITIYSKTPTLNINGLGEKMLLFPSDGELQPGVPYLVTYDQNDDSLVVVNSQHQSVFEELRKEMQINQKGISDAFEKMDINLRVHRKNDDEVFEMDGIEFYDEMSDEIYGIQLKADHINFKQIGSAFYATPNTHSSGALSSDGTYLALVHVNSPFVTVYKREEGAYTRLPRPETWPTGNGQCVEFSPDDEHLVIGHATSPYLTMYSREGDTFTKLKNPSAMPKGTVFGCAYSPNGEYLAITHYDSPYVTIYKRDGDDYTKLENPDISTRSAGRDCAFSPDGCYLAVAHINTPYITVYKRDGDTFTKLANPVGLPTGNGQCCCFSPDNHLVVGSSAGTVINMVAVYKIEDDVLIKLNNLDIKSSSPRCCYFDPSGNNLVIGSQSPAYLSVFKRNGDTFNRLSDVDIASTIVYDAPFSADGKTFLRVGGGPSYIASYSVDYIVDKTVNINGLGEKKLNPSRLGSIRPDVPCLITYNEKEEFDVLSSHYDDALEEMKAAMENLLLKSRITGCIHSEDTRSTEAARTVTLDGITDYLELENMLLSIKAAVDGTLEQTTLQVNDLTPLVLMEKNSCDDSTQIQAGNIYTVYINSADGFAVVK